MNLTKTDFKNLLAIVEAATATGINQARVVVVLQDKLKQLVSQLENPPAPPKEPDVSDTPNGD